MLAHAADIADTETPNTSWDLLSRRNPSSEVVHTTNRGLDQAHVDADRRTGKQATDLTSIVSMVISRLQAAGISSINHAESSEAQSSSTRFESNSGKTSAVSNPDQERFSIQTAVEGAGTASPINQEELVKSIAAVMAEMTGSLGSDTDDPNARICRVCSKRLKRTCDMKYVASCL
jgi:hypothetical protein